MKEVVIDTNVLLVSISKKSKLHWVFESLLEQRYTLCVTTEILNEYAEIIEQHMGSEVSNSVLGALTNLRNVKFVNTYFKFGLLKDEDDNKFVDCAIASGAYYIVSHDKDFNILRSIEFPRIIVIDTTAFKKDLKII